MSDTIPVYEMFKAFQGEGCHMGKAFFFIRTFGCPVKCNFCDSAGTWHPDYIPKDIKRYTADELMAEVLKSNLSRVVITGGEPLVHDLSKFFFLTEVAGIDTHVETSGGFFIKGNYKPAWLTVSPKWDKLPLSENLYLANELKFIITTANDIEAWWNELRLDEHDFGYLKIWLHPEWSQRNNPVVLKAISEAVMEHPDRYRAGYQIHRLYNVDALDSRSRPSVPLGGDPKKEI